MGIQRAYYAIIPANPHFCNNVYQIVLEICTKICYSIHSFDCEVYYMDNEEKKDIEIVSGDGTNLNISPVYDNLDIAKPDEDTNAKKNVVIPDVKK